MVSLEVYTLKQDLCCTSSKVLAYPTTILLPFLLPSAVELLTASSLFTPHIYPIKMPPEDIPKAPWENWTSFLCWPLDPSGSLWKQTGSSSPFDVHTSPGVYIPIKNARQQNSRITFGPSLIRYCFGTFFCTRCISDQQQRSIFLTWGIPSDKENTCGRKRTKV